MYLDGGAQGEILLPNRYVPASAKAGERLDVFVYRDSEDRLVATTETPFAMVGQCAFLRVVSVKANVGAFLDWGLEKDLLLPLREQTRTLRPLDWVVVIVALDVKSDRIVASARLDRWLDQVPAKFHSGEAVQLLVESETPLGWRAIINHTHRGLLYRSDLARPLTAGQALPGYIRAVRSDGKIDLTLEPTGYRRIAPLTEQIMEKLTTRGGRLPYHDKTSPEEIRRAFGVSKKSFKQAVGLLYRARRLVIDAEGISLAAPRAAAVTPSTAERPRPAAAPSPRNTRAASRAPEQRPPRPDPRRSAPARDRQREGPRHRRPD
jgi:predicted RNA-binding protein (virulence factor B family)